MIRKHLFYVLGAIIFTSTTSYAETNKLPDTERSHTEAGFEIVSGRNSTGHWNSKLRFTHSASRGKIEKDNEFEAWKMKFDQKIDAVEEGEIISLYATVTIPPASASAVGASLTDDSVVAPRESYDTVIRHGYERGAGLGYYKFHAEPRTWYGALLKCQAETANLIVVNSEEEARLVRNLFLAHPTIYGAHNNDLAFVGVNDLENEGVYVTIFGDQFHDVGYQKWKQNQPNNYGSEPPGEDCVATDRDGQFYDWECYHKLAFICEKSLE